MNGFKFVLKEGSPLNANVSFDTIDGVSGLVMESRGGGKGTIKERNTDYIEALDTLIQRLKSGGVKHIKVHLVSRPAIRDLKPADRVVIINGNSEINLISSDAESIRKSITRAVQIMMKAPGTKGGNNTKKILIETGIDKTSWYKILKGEKFSFDSHSTISTDGFEVVDSEDAKRRILTSITARQGQPKFRNDLLKAYDNHCAVTGTSYVPILEAAHIIPFNGTKTNVVANGILLRADIHTLFDQGALGIDSSYRIVVSTELEDTEYVKYHGQKIRLPMGTEDYPSKHALSTRELPTPYEP